MLDIASFRLIFPEFGDATVVSDAVIQFNLTLAANSLPPEIWGSRLDAGIGFYAAHYVSLALQRAVAVLAGASPAAAGAVMGLVTSKSVGSVSKSMDVKAGATDGGGSFNLTSYGQAYLTLLDSVAVGAMQF